MKRVITKDYSKDDINKIISRFNTSGESLFNGDRNAIKVFELNDELINVKSFKIPNVFNQIAYKFLRKSKAQRSFEYASKLMQMGIGTPKPIAYYEFTTPLLFKKSFYISEHLDCDLTYRELTKDLNYPNHEEILRAFTRFTYHLHENNINFLDHSPGNTLINKKKDGYDFFLVDLNRMRFEQMDFLTRMKNMAKLTIHKSMVQTMSDEYAKCSGEDYDIIFNTMWDETEAFQYRFHRKIRLKKTIKFWSKKEI